MYHEPLEKVLKDYQPLINATVAKYKNKVANRFSEEDLISDCYMKIWQAHDSWKDGDGESFGGYAKHLINNAMFERFKRAKNLRKNIPTVSMTIRSDEDDTDSQMDIEVSSTVPEVITDTVNAILLGRIDSLKPKARDIFIRYYVNGDSLSEIGKVYNQSRQSIHKSINASTKKIRSVLNAAS